MDCVNHPGIAAIAYCQNCGNALCYGCVRSAATGQILCDPCRTAWQNYPRSFAPPYPCGGPHPALAAFLGLFPGVGAMYNGQFIKGFLHVAIFAVLVSLSNHYDALGILVAAWIVYQSFDAYQTARALRDGQTPPDPLGLNEVGCWLNPASRPRPAEDSDVPLEQPIPGAANPAQAPPYQPPYAAPCPTPLPPPLPPSYWRGREPIGALALIALGILFLLDRLDFFNGRLFSYAWPVLLIVLGLWLLVRRLTHSPGGPL